MADEHAEDRAAGGVSRRGLLRCAPWLGTGVVWGLAGGVPYALGLLEEATAQSASGLTDFARYYSWVQCSCTTKIARRIPGFGAGWPARPPDIASGQSACGN